MYPSRRRNFMQTVQLSALAYATLIFSRFSGLFISPFTNHQAVEITAWKSLLSRRSKKVNSKSGSKSDPESGSEADGTESAMADVLQTGRDSQEDFRSVEYTI